MCLITGRAYDIPTVAMRFFNVYGTRQALSNPYNDVLAIFASRLLNNKAPLIFEDGFQRRDFVHVHDVAQVCRLAMEIDGANGEVFNIGSGKNYSIREIGENLAKVLGKDDIEPEITAKYRAGDIRHCFADISKARRVLGYEPRVTLEEGLTELVGWLEANRRRSRRAGAPGTFSARIDRMKSDKRTSKKSGDLYLITGGAGFIGTNVAARLASNGERVRIFDNLSRKGVETNSNS